MIFHLDFWKLDSSFIMNDNFHSSQKLYEALMKLRCMAIGDLRGTPAWKKATSIASWNNMKCPQQNK